ncbi:uncharacterized protein BJ212DRAFT_1480720 [Suillus subaureus]|uniref:ATPase AAA-type core domain-containing protein n=1 Tax=Suillus subaureus TaxID=48587 RepID=A0A9P7EC14_9AGAM|nr:uncharacterized protein BJ212DRAFT_1480720 [Suillus subaureus]KAG1816863.1 hypothetical protein BJ212DRAFT_1480720 [Suillus subaureus]
MENMEVLAIDRLSWVAEYDEWVTFGGLDSDASSYNQDGWRKLVKDQQTKDLIQSLLDTIECSPGSPQKVRQGMNILFEGEPGTGKRTFAHAVCTMLKHPMFDIRVIPFNVNVQPWDRYVPFERINTMIQEFESPGCICLWPSQSDPTASPTFPIVAIKFHTLDRAARCQRWLELFGRDDLATTFSSGEHASGLTVRDTKTRTFLEEIEEISWYKLNGADIEDFMTCARHSSGEQDPTPQHVKVALEAWEAPLPLRRKVARFLVHSWNASTRLCE